MEKQFDILTNNIIYINEVSENKHDRAPLLDAMMKYRDSKSVPFDVPGHKFGRGAADLAGIYGEEILALDFNSMKCLDILSNPVSVIKEAEALLADAYGGDHGFFVVNGTSAAVRSMIMAVCKPGEKIIVPRNAHKSAISGLIMSGAMPVYVQPEYDKSLGLFHGMDTDFVKKAIDENPDAKAVFVINPTYYGAVSDLREIVDYAHDRNMAVIVDEAHGAHLKFHGDLPPSAMEAGADIASISTHKTGGSMSQSSVIVSREGMVSASRIRSCLNMNGTTSSSYILMGSIDSARRNLALRGEEIFDRILELCRWARDEINKLDGFYAFGKEIKGLPGVYDFDETKLVVNTCGIGMTGFELYDLLRDEYNIQLELGDTYNVLAIISLGDSWHQLSRLVEALKDISSRKYGIKKVVNHLKDVGELECRMTPRDAYYSNTETVAFRESAGRISCESIMAYPPGIPIVIPGEVITENVIEYALFLKENNALITDIEDNGLESIKVAL
ncbi:Arginine/lysine/ornithine decarboxylase [Dethiosulfatibacter aminovorans DSM 17477]|uniref:Arginine/lysine/ornithine decarboxylase n=1 Tax=Dethiosulfatibacter aminovorans DSM 17477 TaxID=1121476 RepID=A0A1M6KIX1_9FIRM|nr:aminotransferase class I/II-fold pyridoxal phosphate-dependent enzyme [Dethiosulfatibacter aminovorans]SHJ58873.1 Arginine/lysine/ornithine decarboxylase [Dethiosulfatibacter aminovorans DSM 17477]